MGGGGWPSCGYAEFSRTGPQSAVSADSARSAGEPLPLPPGVSGRYWGDRRKPAATTQDAESGVAHSAGRGCVSRGRRRGLRRRPPQA